MKTLQDLTVFLGREATTIERLLFDVYKHDENYEFVKDNYGNLKAILKIVD